MRTPVVFTEALAEGEGGGEEVKEGGGGVGEGEGEGEGGGEGGREGGGGGEEGGDESEKRLTLNSSPIFKKEPRTSKASVNKLNRSQGENSDFLSHQLR